MPNCEFNSGTNTDWTDLPLHIVVYEWFMKNMYIPTDLGTLVAYIGLFLITWYTIIWVVRVLMSIIWPLFIVSTAIVVFRILQFYEPDEITDIMTKSFTIVADTLVTVLCKAMELVLGFFE